MGSAAIKINIGLVDDHQLFIKSLSLLLSGFGNFSVVVDASNGKDLQEKMKSLAEIPHIMLIDAMMPVMDGMETAQWLRENYPGMRLVALSMNDREQVVIGMLRAGCCAYLFKDTHPDELEKALNTIHHAGFYNSGATTINVQQLLTKTSALDTIQISKREKDFLTHICSDMTYKEIASLMNLSERTIDGYREVLFEKLNVKSRTGMALEAIRRGWVPL